MPNSRNRACVSGDRVYLRKWFCSWQCSNSFDFVVYKRSRVNLYAAFESIILRNHFNPRNIVQLLRTQSYKKVLDPIWKCDQACDRSANKTLLLRSNMHNGRVMLWVPIWHLNEIDFFHCNFYKERNVNVTKCIESGIFVYCVQPDRRADS